MAFPEVQSWINNLTTLSQLIGVGFFVISFCGVGLIFMTAFGSDRRGFIAKAAAGSAILGLFFVAAAPAIQAIVQRIAGK